MNKKINKMTISIYMALEKIYKYSLEFQHCLILNLMTHEFTSLNNCVGTISSSLLYSYHLLVYHHPYNGVYLYAFKKIDTDDAMPPKLH